MATGSDQSYGNLFTGVCLYFITSFPVLFGVSYSEYFVRTANDASAVSRKDLLDDMCAWDGAAYRSIAISGYEPQSLGRSNVAYFPGYPVLCASLYRVSSLRIEIILLFVSHVMLLAVFLLLAEYAKDVTVVDKPRFTRAVLLVFGLIPYSLFVRMAYSESTFLVAVLCAMLGMRRNWNIGYVVLSIACATFTRFAGLALLLPFACYLWCKRQSAIAFILQAVTLVPLAASGLFIYMAYLFRICGDPLAFAATQIYYGEVQVGFAEQFAQCLRLEPFAQVYDSSHVCYWSNSPPRTAWFFNLRFWNPIVFMFACAAIAGGLRVRCITRSEAMLSAGLLAIPYFGHAAQACMASQARYTVVAFPIYFFVAFVVCKSPRMLQLVYVIVSSLWLSAFASLFGKGYWIY